LRRTLRNHSIHFTVISWSPQLRICPPIRDRKYSVFTFWAKFRPGYAQLDFPMSWFFLVSCCMVMVIGGTAYTVYQRKRLENTQNGGTVLPIANLMADSESGIPDSYSTVLVTTRLSRLVSEIFAYGRQTDGRTDNVDHYYSWIRSSESFSKMNPYIKMNFLVPISRISTVIVLRTYIKQSKRSLDEGAKVPSKLNRT